MSKTKTVRFIGGVLQLALATTVGMGFTYINYVEEDGLVTRLVTRTWIPFFVLGAAVIAGLMLLGAVPVRGRRVSPWTLLPAAVLADGYNGDAIVQDGLDLIASRRRLRFKSVGI